LRHQQNADTDVDNQHDQRQDAALGAPAEQLHRGNHGDWHNETEVEGAKAVNGGAEPIATSGGLMHPSQNGAIMNEISEPFLLTVAQVILALAFINTAGLLMLAFDFTSYGEQFEAREGSRDG
jgi:hypothetical protein